MIKIKTSTRFAHQFKHLPKEVRLAALEEIGLFEEEPFHPSLDTHPLRNEFKGFFAFSISSDLRVIFRFTKPDLSEVMLHKIGTHEIYK